MNMEKRALLAIVISMFIVIFAPYALVKFFPQLKQEQKKAQYPIKESDRPIQPKETQQTAKQEVPPPVFEGKAFDFETDDYKIVFSGSSGAIRGIFLKKFFDPKGEPLVLAETSGAQNAIFSASGLSRELDNAIFVYTVKAGRPVFTARTSDGLTLEREYIFQPGRYTIELKQTITNNSPDSLPLKYSIVTSSGITDLSPQDVMYVDAVRDVDGKISRMGKNDIKGQTSWSGRQVNWVSLKNRYFSLITKPPLLFPEVSYNKLQDNKLQTRISSMEFTAGPNASVTHNFILYAGPNDYDKISNLKMGMEDSLYLGFTGSIGKILFVVLKFFYGAVKNWGLAIIALTVFINILLFPLTFKGIKSMKQMQALQPKIEALRKTHKGKGDSQKLNKEVMELYRKHKINPMGGCLPLLLQMPVFFALYQVLMKSAELRGAPFLWIKDLSQPDRLIEFNSSIPLLGKELNILPLLMAVAMFFQQKLSTPPQTSSGDQMAQQQKMMAIMMPILFGFLFYRLPSGLVMYWFINTILTLAEQELFLKKEMFHVEHSES